MYNTHRGMVPAPNSRLTELLDQLRQEFESQSRSTGEYEHQCMIPASSHRINARSAALSYIFIGIFSFPLFPSVAQSING